ncbi:hypothetical protein Btru_020505 [Bulinus truncatus]|nr:hypothetical protein Btru_020505 [Bulinus truncatus]
MSWIQLLYQKYRYHQTSIKNKCLFNLFIYLLLFFVFFALKMYLHFRQWSQSEVTYGRLPEAYTSVYKPQEVMMEGSNFTHPLSLIPSRWYFVVLCRRQDPQVNRLCKSACRSKYRLVLPWLLTSGQSTGWCCHGYLHQVKVQVGVAMATYIRSKYRLVLPWLLTSGQSTGWCYLGYLHQVKVQVDVAMATYIRSKYRSHFQLREGKKLITRHHAHFVFSQSESEEAHNPPLSPAKA